MPLACYQKNISALQKKYPEIIKPIYDLVASGPDVEDVSFSRIGRQDYVAHTLAQLTKPEQRPFCLLFGFEGMLPLKQLQAAMPWLAELVIYEPDLIFFKSIINQIDISAILLQDHIHFIFSELNDEAIAKVQINSFLPLGAWITLCPPEMEARYPEKISVALNYWTDLQENFATSLQTTLSRSELIANNFYHNFVKLIQQPLVNSLRNYYQGCPMICVAAGPSLSDNLAFLQQHHAHAIVLCADRAFPVLLNAGIKPHFVVALDPAPAKFEWFQLNAKLTEGIPLIAGQDVHHSLLDVWQGPVYLVLSGRKNMMDVAYLEALFKLSDSRLPSLYSVSLTAVMLAVELGASSITLIGQDLAYADGKSHAQGTTLTRNVSQGESGQAWVSGVDGTTMQALIEVPDYHGGITYTTPVMAFYRKEFGRYICGLSVPVYNLTTQGARIDGVERVIPSQLEALFTQPITYSLPEPQLSVTAAVKATAKTQIATILNFSNELDTWLLHQAETLNLLVSMQERTFFLEQLVQRLYTQNALLVELIYAQIPQIVLSWRKDKYVNLQHLDDGQKEDFLYQSIYSLFTGIQLGVQRLRDHFSSICQGL